MKRVFLSSLINFIDHLCDIGYKSAYKWLKKIFEWTIIKTYFFSVHRESGKTLDQIGSDYMEKKAEQVVEGN